MKKGVLSALLALCLLFTGLPINVLAIDSGEVFSVEDDIQELSNAQEIWDRTIADSYAGGGGTSGDPYLISNGAQLARFANQVNSGAEVWKVYQLTNDIYLNDITNVEAWDNNPPQNQWTPIGTSVNQFMGSFSGKGFCVYGLYISTSDNYQGLFGVGQNNAGIFDVGVDKSYIKGGSHVAAVCGQKLRGDISGNHDLYGCYSGATVIGQDAVGGIVGSAPGDMFGYTIRNCHNTGSVTGRNLIGGIVGYCDSGTVSNCYNVGDITGNDRVGGIAGKTIYGSYCWNAGKVAGGNCVAGIIGEAPFYGSSSSSISCSFNAGEITGRVHVAGIVGYSAVYSYMYRTSISNCYNIGTIKGESNYVAGIGPRCYKDWISESDNMCEFTNCYNTGNIDIAGSGHIGPIFSNGTLAASNNLFYLAGCCGENYKNPYGQVAEKSSDDMITAEFVTQLNASSSAWKQDTEGYNDGYPILNGIDYSVFASFHKKPSQKSYSIIEAVQRYTTGDKAQRLVEIEDMNISQEEKMRLLVELFGLDDITEIREGIEYVIDTETERWAYHALMTDDMYCANNYKEYVASHPEVQLTLLASSLIFAGEINDWIDINTYLEADYPGVSKYKTMLLDFMEYSQESIKAVSIIKDINSLLKNTTKLTQETIIAELDKCDTYKEMIYFLSSHGFSDIILNTDSDHIKKIDGIPYVTNVELDEDCGFGKFAKRVDQLGKIVKVGNVALSSIRDIVEFDSVLALYEEYDEFLVEISSAKELPVGMRVAALQLQKDLKNGYLGKIMDVSLTAIEQFTDSAITGNKMDAIYKTLGISSFKDFLTTVKMTAWFINQATDVGEMVNASATTEAYAKLGAYYKKKLEQSEKAFLQNESEENAWDFYYNYTMLWNIRTAGEDAYLDMCKIEGLLSFLFENQYNEKEKVVKDTKEILKKSRFVKIKIGEPPEGKKLYKFKTIVECPVDIEICTNDGNHIVTLRDRVECDFVNQYGRFVSRYRSFDDDYVKILYWNSYEDCEVKLTATDDGIVSVSQLSDDSSTKCNVFCNVVLHQYDSMRFKPSNPNKATVTSPIGTQNEISAVEINVKASETIYVAGVSLPASITLSQGEKQVLPIAIEPQNATYQDVYWFTSDASIVTVSNGVILACGPGEAEITCVTEDGELSSTCTVRVDSAHTILFDQLGGVLSQNKFVTDRRGCLPVLPTPTRSGYIFLGWFTSPTSGTQVTTDTVFTQDTTIYAHWQKNSSGGGSGGYPSVSYYSVKVEKSEHGTVTSKPTSVYSGGTVTLTVTPDKGYKLDGLIVTDSQGKEIGITESVGKYTFKMPSRNVTVIAKFVPKQTSTPIPLPDATPTPTPDATPTPDTSPTPQPWKNHFPDVSDTAWYIKAVEYVAVEGLMHGYPNGKFGPNDNISRAEFAQIIYNKAGRPNAGSSVFTDVKTGQWYTNAVTWAAEQKVVSGIGNNQFAPNRDISREELATMLWRYAGSPKPAKTTLDFTDAGKVSTFAKEAMLWANEHGIISGKGNGILDPKGKATRAETAQMLMNYLKK